MSYHDGIVVKKGTHSYKLSELANLRSGDKGDTANIGMCYVHMLTMIAKGLVVHEMLTVLYHFLC